MDGFHLSNDLLDASGLRSRKGAPETFDAYGFLHLMACLKTGDQVYFPIFDRTHDMSINAAEQVAPEIKTAIVEGSYLLLDREIWRDLTDRWDLIVLLHVPEATLTDHLIARWRHHGLSKASAQERALSNDIPNAKTVTEHSLPAEININTP